MQAEQFKITIASTEEFTNMILKDEKKNEKERSEHEGKLRNLTINNNQVLIELWKRSKKFLC